MCREIKAICGRMLLLILCGAAGALATRGPPPVPAPTRAVAAAPTPPMGWNSWDSYGLTIDEAQFRQNAAVEAKLLLPFGYRYAVIDEGWFLKNPQDRAIPEKLQYQIDRFGRYVPVPSRFASSVDPSGDGAPAFRNLSAYLRSIGLRFGIHVIRGIPRASVDANTPIEGGTYHANEAADTSDTCPWDPTNWGVRHNPAGQAWYDALMRQYASWGVDLLKVDCIATNPYRPAEIRMIRAAIDKTGRPMVLSLSPGPTVIANATLVGKSSEMWRISGDVWDAWATHRSFPQGVGEQFTLAAAWAAYTQPGNWPDADMLPLGQLGPVPGYGTPRMTQLTHDEQRTMLTLWSMLRSPLIVGANLTALDAWTTALLTNRDVLDIDQRSRNGRQIEGRGPLVVWKAEGMPGTAYLALFNIGDEPIEVHRRFSDFGFDAKRYEARDLWSEAGPVQTDVVATTLGAHACLLLKVTDETDNGDRRKPTDR